MMETSTASQTTPSAILKKSDLTWLDGYVGIIHVARINTYSTSRSKAEFTSKMVYAWRIVQMTRFTMMKTILVLLVYK